MATIGENVVAIQVLIGMRATIDNQVRKDCHIAAVLIRKTEIEYECNWIDPGSGKIVKGWFKQNQVKVIP